MGTMGLLLSVAMLVAVARRGAQAATLATDRFWIFVAAMTVQIGALTVVSSLMGRYEPATVLALQAALTGAVFALTGRPRPDRPDAGDRANWDAASLCMLGGIAVLLVMTGARQALMPIWGMDEQGYHAPRIMYWLQNRSVFIPPTHDFRQTTFPFGCEMIVGWPLMFVKREWPIRMAFWMSYPLSIAAVYSLCKQTGLSRRAALAGAFLIAVTPTITWHTATLKVDAWLPLYLCGACYWVMRPHDPGAPVGRKYLWAGLFLALATNVKTTALGLAPGLLLGALLELQPRAIFRASAGLVVGFLGGALATGLAVVLALNVRRYGHPLGSPIITEIVQPDLSLQQAYVHAMRVPFYLAEVPEIPVESFRQWIERVTNDLANRVGATTPLRWENGPAFPGGFHYYARTVSFNYSTGGLVWLPALWFGFAAALADFWRSMPRPRLRPAPFLALAQIPLLAGLIFLVRWMNGGPERFWIGAYALSIPVTVWMFERWTRRSCFATVVVAAALVLTAHPTFRLCLWGLEQAIVRPSPADVLDGGFREVVPKIPSHSRILLFAKGQTREWGLFRPRQRFTNAVIPWGMDPFDAAKIQALMEDQRITHVVVENDAVAGYRWSPEMSGALVDWLRANPELREIPLETVRMHLFVRKAAATGPSHPEAASRSSS